MHLLIKLAMTAAAVMVSAAAQAASMGKAGSEFKDCDTCPTMVVLPKGSFTMGSPKGEQFRFPNEEQRKVTISYPLAVGKFEITFDEWDACFQQLKCRPHKDEGRGRGLMPVINVDWTDAQEYVRWLSSKTGHTYRLMTEAEWEYAARAGSKEAFSWGGKASHKYANYGSDICCETVVKENDQWHTTGPVGQFKPNKFGLHDLHGNVWEWVQDCWDENAVTGPLDGSARETEDCQLRIMRGGSWASMPMKMRAAFRDGVSPLDSGDIIGFRIARTE